MLKFGTDGVRGVAGLDLTPELVVALGRAAARVLPANRCIIGRDTRRSGPMLEGALAAGLAAEGMDIDLLGECPTPAVGWLAAREPLVLGAVVSGSHNPWQDNGIKLFAPGGRKLTDEEEDDLESELAGLLAHGRPIELPTRYAIGTTRRIERQERLWRDAIAQSYDGPSLAGLHIVVDTAHGAASKAAPKVLRALGAEKIKVLNHSPDGVNINDGCGSTHPEMLQKAVVQVGADLGIALDGDADRVLLVDAAGQLIDGDQIIGIAALDRHRRGRLKGDAVVVTVMSNLGFRRGMEAHGIEVVEVPVGDRHVLAAMNERGLELGGEQSGHVVFKDLVTTGDGLLTAVQLLSVVASSGRSLAELADEAMTRLPQVLRNVEVKRSAQKVAQEVAAAAAAEAAALGSSGRVLLRPSGTEPLVRVMVEAPTLEEAEAVADRLVAAVEARP